MTRNTAQTLLTVATGIFGASGCLCAPFAPFAAMGFDAPGSENNPVIWLLVIAMISYPLVCLGALVGAWLLFKRDRYQPACVIAALPLINVLIVIGVYLPQMTFWQ